MRRILAFLRRNGWLLLIGAILEGLIGFQVVRSIEPTYQATSVVALKPGSTGVNGGPDAQPADLLVRTAAEAMRTRPVLEQAATDVGLDPTTPGLERNVSVTPVRDTRILRVSAEDGSAQRAAALANAIPQVLNQRMVAAAAADLGRQRANLERLSQQQRAESEAAARRLQELQAQPPDPAREADLVNLRNQAALLEASYTATVRDYQNVLSLEYLSAGDGIEVLEPAIPPAAPIRPSYVLLTLLAIVAGTALALLLALARERLDDTLGDAERVRLRLDLPTLGMVAGPGADYELLAGRCRALMPERVIPSAVVTAASPVEQASSVAVNLSIALARYGDRVLVVDVESAEASPAHTLAAADDQFARQQPLDNDNEGYVLRNTPVAGLHVLASATPKGSESALALKSHIEQLPGQWDTVVFDAPPVLERPQAAVLASYVEVVLLVVDPRHSSARATLGAIRNLNAVGAQILGVILNVQPQPVRQRESAPEPAASQPVRPAGLPRAQVAVRDSTPSS